MRLKGGGSLTIRNRELSDSPSEVSPLVVPVVTTPSAFADVVDGDAEFREYVAAVYHAEGQLRLLGDTLVEYVSLDTSVANIDGSGVITRVSAGQAAFLVRGKRRTLRVNLDLTDQSDPAGSRTFLGGLAGTLGVHMDAQITPLIDGGMSRATNGFVFSTQNHASSVYVRHANCWARTLDWTGVSPWNDNGGVRKAGVLVTRRHVLNAAHYPFGIGTVIRFVDDAGVVHDRTVVGAVSHPDYSSPVPSHPDFRIYTLNSDLPISIKSYKVLASNRLEYLKHVSYTKPAGVVFDQEERAIINDFTFTDWQAGYSEPVTSPKSIFGEPLIGGDSGNPAFIVVDGEPILTTVLTFGGGGSGTNIAGHVPAINAMIIAADTQAGVSTGYTVTEADFSMWPNFTTKNYLLGDDGAGNKSAWVEDGLENGKMSYALRESENVYRKLFWEAGAWHLTPNLDWTAPPVYSDDDSSANDVATPDLAMFTDFSFTNP